MDAPVNSAVTLDLWLTLVAESDGSQKSMVRYERRGVLAAEVLSKHGLSVGHEPLAKANAEISRLVTADHDLGIDLGFVDRVRQMLEMIDEDIPERLGEAGVVEVGDAIDSAFLESPPSFLPGSREALEFLRGHDVKVALISNTGMTSAPTYREWFGREGMLDYFDHLVFSNEVACAKPSPDIFCPALAHLDVAPERSLHIGDNLLTDISGASGVGMRTGWISGYDDREAMIPPDFTLASILDLPAVFEQWQQSN